MLGMIVDTLDSLALYKFLGIPLLQLICSEATQGFHHLVHSSKSLSWT